MANNPSFETFLEGWFIRQQHYLDELLSAQNNRGEDEMKRSLIARVLSHYREYYEANSRGAREDVFRMVSPPWLSNLERTFVWIAGLKPSLAFRIATRSVGDMSEEQVERMEMLKEETKFAEKDMEIEMVRVQERVVMPTMVEIAMRGERVLDGERRDLDREIQIVREGMEVLVRNADIVRATTMREIVDILSPVQGVRFLAGFAQFQLMIRRWGLQRDTNGKDRGDGNTIPSSSSH